MTITWNYNGGTGLPATSVLNPGAAFGLLPTPNARTGYTFAGWFDTNANTGGRQIFNTSIVPNTDTTYWARWVADSVATTLTLNTPATVTITSGSRQEVRFTAPFAGNYSFESTDRGFLNPTAYVNATGSAFYDDDSGTDFLNYKFRQTLAAGQVFSYYSGVNNDIITANGSYTVTVTEAFSSSNVTITWNASGGFVSPATSSLTSGTLFGWLPTPSRTGCTFGGWYTGINGTGMTISGSSVVPSINTTYYAKWTVNISWISPNGIVWSPWQEWIPGTPFGTLPTPNDMAGFVFTGWFSTTTITEGTQITGNSIVPDTDTTYWAGWRASAWTFAPTAWTATPSGSNNTDSMWSTLASNQSWLAVTETGSTDQTGNDSVMNTADANAETIARAALVTIDAGEMSQLVAALLEPYASVYVDISGAELNTSDESTF